MDRKRREATRAVIETIVRSDYTDGTQMYYKNPDENPLADILERGRTGIEKSISIIDSTKHVPHKSRFALSWNEVHGYVVLAVTSTTSHLQKQITEGGIVLRVPTRTEFQSAGENYPHFGAATTWEHFYDSTPFGRRLIGGYRDDGGLRAVADWTPDDRNEDVGFRLQAVSRPQKLPR